MRPVRIRLGVACRGACSVSPGSAFAQTPTGTDAAIAELRQLLADQRAALDRQAHIIEEQGRTLEALRQRVEGVNPTALERREPEAPALATAATQPPESQPVSRTAAERPPDLPAAVVSAGEFPGSIRIPGTESAFKLGGQARNGRRPYLERTRDRRSIRDVLDSCRDAESRRGGAHGLLPEASRLSTELRMPSPRGPLRAFIESDFAGPAGR